MHWYLHTRMDAHTYVHTHKHMHVDMHAYMCAHLHVRVQWSPSKMDTIGMVKFVLYKKVSFIQGFLNAILIHFGTYANILFTEGVLNSGVSF